MAKPKGSPKTGGRATGTPNKATQDVRQCIALFAENNVAKLEEWLNRTAEGDRIAGVKPDPGKAADLFLKAIEYHIPKLGRVEHTGEGGGPVRIIASDLDERI
jgi:hypothetical protein